MQQDPFYAADVWLPVNTQATGSATPRWEMARQRPRAHFKMGGPLVALYELVAYEFGTRLLHLPMARTYKYDYSGPEGTQTGTISVEDDDHWGPWDQFTAVPFFDSNDHLGSCRRLLTNLQALRDMTVFDVWIRNQDRHLGNILVNEREEEARYDVVLIDHSHVLLGPGRQYEQGLLASHGEPPSNYLRSEEIGLAKNLVRDFSQLEDAVERIGCVENLLISDRGGSG
jgi:hypothetical protein